MNNEKIDKLISDLSNIKKEVGKGTSIDNFNLINNSISELKSMKTEPSEEIEEVRQSNSKSFLELAKESRIIK